MSTEGIRERIVRLVREMRANTVGRGASPSEAAAFAAKAAEWIEKWQISEAELRGLEGGSAQPEFEVCQNKLRTGKKVFNPGMTAIVNALARGMCCKCIMLPVGWDGVKDVSYGIVGDTLDADYVCQVAICVVPALETMADLEGREHGCEKGGLVRWRNQYLIGASEEILRRLEAERKERAEVKEMEHRLALAQGSGTPSPTALACITGETIALAKREQVEVAFKEMYPVTYRKGSSQSGYDGTARSRGREAGKRVGLHIAIE